MNLSPMVNRLLTLVLSTDHTKNKLDINMIWEISFYSSLKVLHFLQKLLIMVTQKHCDPQQGRHLTSLSYNFATLATNLLP
jgi:hypothetical protein